MNNTAFTSGPWVVEGDMIAQTIDAVDSVEIAFLSEIGGPMTKDMAIANANLISSAPDLCQALYDMVKWLDSEDDITYQKINAIKALAKAGVEYES